MKTSFKIGTVLGIPIHIHISLLLILPVFAWFFALTDATSFGINLGFGNVPLSYVSKWILGTVTAILFFLCILLHELAHSYVAQKHGTRIRGIVLLIFGGIAQMEEAPRDAKMELKMALVGPSTSIAIGSFCFLAYFITKDSSYVLNILPTLLGIMAFYNVLLGLFNLMPAFPMDGGRILRASLAKRMPYLGATETATSIGKTFAMFFGVFGLFFNPWFILIAFFIYLGAGEEEKIAKIAVSLEGILVEDIMTKEVKTVKGDMQVNELIDRMLSDKHMGYPVVNGGLDGIVTFADTQKIPKEKHSQVKVKDIMTKQVVTISPREEATSALKTMARRNIGRLVVVESEQIAGIVTRSDVFKSVQILSVRKGY